ncbi:gonadotropin-releasing hormone receptor [Lethenteron reissneri]|uniref:gonadotropin-releasing hormone receptor n=1 Tax=Lethenteron reissneri TaxID=7753 RepID=UPI002AB725C5|nr:gonadotropin-releasing hormone receptor [Lethenteron reissneri]
MELLAHACNFTSSSSSPPSFFSSAPGATPCTPGTSPVTSHPDADPRGVDPNMTTVPGSNLTGPPLHPLPLLPTFSAAARVRVCVTLILLLASATLNGMVLRSACLDRRTRSRRQRGSHVRLLMLHLSAADLLFTLLVMPLDAAWNVTLEWRAGDAACRLLMFLKLFAMYASAFVTAVISLDRYSAVVNPLAFGQAKRRSRVTLCLAWALSAVLALPQLVLFRVVQTSRPGPQFTQCATHGSFPQRWQGSLYFMFTFACLFLLPLLIMVFCYARILLEIVRRGRERDGVAHDAKGVTLRCSSNNIPRARLRTVKMTAAIVGSFLVCWTPYYLVGIWYWFWPAALDQGTLPEYINHIVFLFGLLNACLDPLVYGLFSGQWHGTLCYRFCCCYCCCWWSSSSSTRHRRRSGTTTGATTSSRGTMASSELEPQPTLATASVDLSAQLQRQGCPPVQ